MTPVKERDARNPSSTPRACRSAVPPSFGKRVLMLSVLGAMAPLVGRGAPGGEPSGNAVKLEASGGARTEILGAFIYPHKSIPDRRPVFINRDARLAAVYGLSIYQHNHPVQIRDVEDGEVTEIGNDRLRWSGSRAHMDLYVSHPEP